MDGHLDVHLLGYRQAVVDGRRRGAPVFMQLEADGAGGDLLGQCARQRGVALAEKTQVHREGVGGLHHLLDVPGAGRAGGRIGAGGRPGAAAEHGGDPAHERLFDLLRADEVDVGIDATGGDDVALAGNHLGTRADGDGHPGLDVRVACLADGADAAMLDADVGLDDAPVVDDQRVGDDRVGHIGRE